MPLSPLTTRPLALVFLSPSRRLRHAICTPDPGVVDDGVIRVDLEIDCGTANSGSSNAKEDVVQGRWDFFR